MEGWGWVTPGAGSCMRLVEAAASGNRLALWDKGTHRERGKFCLQASTALPSPTCTS